MFVGIYVRAFIGKYSMRRAIDLFELVCVCVCDRLYASFCVYVPACVCIYLCVFSCMVVCACVYVCVLLCIRMCVCVISLWKRTRLVSDIR